MSGGNYSWLTTVKANIATDAIKDLWGAESGTQTKYDPCPAGWRVAPQAAWKFYNDAAVTKEIVFAAGVESPANKDPVGTLYLDRRRDEVLFPVAGRDRPRRQLLERHRYEVSLWKGLVVDGGRDLFPFVRNDGLADLGRLHGGYTQGYELPVRCVKL